MNAHRVRLDLMIGVSLRDSIDESLTQSVNLARLWPLTMIAALKIDFETSVGESRLGVLSCSIIFIGLLFKGSRVRFP